MKKMEDDIDIYADLPSFETKCDGDFVSNNEENITHEHVKLKKQIEELSVQLENFRKINENMEVNMVSLLKTAKAEIARKDKMIEDLRKQLDDAAFKRGIYARTNEYLARKSTSRGGITNTCHKSVDFPLPPIEIKQEPLEVDSTCNIIKDPNSIKSTLTPITIFGERLRKRIADEQNLERKDKQPSKFTVNGNNGMCVEGYVAESDKENGSMRDTNSCNMREIEVRVDAQYSENERTKSPKITSRISSKDFLASDKNETDTNLQRNSVLAVNCTGKRANDDPGKSIPAKRIKFEGEEYFSGSTNKEGNEKVAVEFKKKRDSARYNKFESSDKFCEMERVTKSSDTELDYKMNADIKKRGYLIDNTVKKDERKNVKDEDDVSYDKKVTKVHFTKRHYKHAETPMLKSNEGDIYYRCTEIARKDDYRSDAIEYHRAKQKEDRRGSDTDDYRSRTKSTSYKYYRKEKYIKNKYSKHVSCGDKESCDPRSTTKHSSMDRKTNNLQSSKHYDDSGFRRLKSVGRTTKPYKKQNEIDDCSSHWKSGVVKSIARSQYSEVSKRERSHENSCERSREKSYEKSREKSREKVREKSCEKSREKSREKNRENSIETKECLASIVQVRRHVLTENELPQRPHDLASTSQKHDDQLQNLKELEKVKIEVTPNNSLSKDNEREGLKKRQHDCDEVNVSVQIDIGEKEIECNNVHDELVKDSNVLSNDVPTCLPIASPGKQRLESNENIDNVENVENIEKFIRNYAFNDENLEKAESVSEAADRENLSKHTKKCVSTNDNAYEYEKNSGEHHIPESNVRKPLPLDGKQETNVKINTIEPSDTSPCGSEHYTENDRIEMQLALETPVKHTENFTKVNECALQNYIELSEKESDCLKIEGFVENTSEVLRNHSLKSYEKESNVNGGDVGVCKDLNTSNPVNYNNDQNIQNDRENDLKGKSIVENTCVTIQSVQEKKDEINKRPIREEQLNELEMSTDKSNVTNAKYTSTKIHGKVILFARRKKPVCLANNNANMTVLINNTSDSSINSTDTSNKKECNFPLKLRARRRSRREENDVVSI